MILEQKEDHNFSRRSFIDFLTECLVHLKSLDQDPSHTAYLIAGMLDTEFAKTLEDHDPLTEIMIIAGELEVSPVNKSELTAELIEKIEIVKNER